MNGRATKNVDNFLHCGTLVIFWYSQPHAILKAPVTPLKLDTTHQSGDAGLNLLLSFKSKGLSLSTIPTKPIRLIPPFSLQSTLAATGPVNCPSTYAPSCILHQIGVASTVACLIDVKASVTNKPLDILEITLHSLGKIIGNISKFLRILLLDSILINMKNIKPINNTNVILYITFNIKLKISKKKPLLLY
jgi:hypothetical protein